MGDKENDPFKGTWVPASVLTVLSEMGIQNLNRYFGCLMVTKGRIDDDMRNLLMREAVSLVCLKRSSNRFKTDWCEGHVTTTFGHAHLGGLSGIKFECELDVDVESKTMKVAYIVTSSLLDRFPATEWLRNQSDEGPPLKTSYFN